MRKKAEFNILNTVTFRNRLITYLARWDTFCILNSNSFTQPGKNNHSGFGFLAAAGTLKKFCSFYKNPFDELYGFWEKNNDWLFGHFSYGLKNYPETLSSENPDYIGFPEISFFVPRFIFELKNNKFIISYRDSESSKTIKDIFNDIKNTQSVNFSIKKIMFRTRFTRNEYLNIVNSIKRHIKAGDIYEMNFCQEFYNTQIDIRPENLYIKLCEHSPSPFSCFYRIGSLYLISASPERYLNKSGEKVISQPVKGTAAVGKTAAENKIIEKNLMANMKERAENIMITDLVRNDLSRTAVESSVKVDELCGIYKFPQVFQMISTVSSVVAPETRFTDIIKYSFPMGSMTGTPKIRAMELIERYEKTDRGLYSGSVGYITPEGNFDLNVVIRSLQYNSGTKYLSFITGGAITYHSVPENEYNECLVKAAGILKTVTGKIK